MLDSLAGNTGPCFEFRETREKSGQVACTLGNFELF